MLSYFTSQVQVFKQRPDLFSIYQLWLSAIDRGSFQRRQVKTLFPETHTTPKALVGW
jgi:hypothetical protein